MAAIIQLKGVHKSFRNGRDKVLDGVDLDFETGKLTYIMGPSGVGKSVTLKHVLGLLSPDKGEVWVDGSEMSTLSGENLSLHRRKFGMLFQNAALFDDMTIFQNVAFPLWEHSSLSDEIIFEKATNALTQLGIATGHDKFPNELSGGMKKRVALARAIILEPKILLYDEPTTGLDPVTRKTVDELIAELKERLRLTSIVISHDIPSALLLGDEIAFLHQGKIVFKGTPDEFVKSEHPQIVEFLEAEKRTIRAFRENLSN